MQADVKTISKIMPLPKPEGRGLGYKRATILGVKRFLVSGVGN